MRGYLAVVAGLIAGMALSCGSATAQLQMQEQTLGSPPMALPGGAMPPAAMPMPEAMPQAAPAPEPPTPPPAPEAAPPAPAAAAISPDAVQPPATAPAPARKPTAAQCQARAKQHRLHGSKARAFVSTCLKP